MARGVAGAIENNASGESRLENVITAVKPGTATRGRKHSVRIDLAPGNARSGGVPTGKPDWAQIGPFEATRIERSGNVVSIEIDIPADAAVGVLLDCHIEFEGAGGRRGPLAFKKNDAFRVVE